jgi:hypothetical protein
MRIKKYTHFITESDEVIKDSTFDGIKDDVRKMIEDTIKVSGGESVKSFAKNYKDKPNDVKIEGLINDDQVYDFWLKYENEIDELLNKVKFFEESPDEINALGTYKYIIASTNRAILEIVRMLAE